MNYLLLNMTFLFVIIFALKIVLKIIRKHTQPTYFGCAKYGNPHYRKYRFEQDKLKK